MFARIAGAGFLAGFILSFAAVAASARNPAPEPARDVPAASARLKPAVADAPAGQGLRDCRGWPALA